MAGIPYPTDLLDDINEALDVGFNETLANLELDDDKIKEMDRYTVASVTESFKMFSRISGPDVSRSDRDEVSETMQVVRGPRLLLDKEAFVSNTSVSYIDFHKVPGRSIREDYANHISIKFASNTTIRYQVPSGNTFSGIDRLHLKAEEHVIVAFDVNIDYLSETNQVELVKISEEVYKYNGIHILLVYGGISSTSRTLFVLRKDQLPMIRHRDWTEIEGMDDKVKETWRSMVQIDDDLKIYRKITELDKSETLLNDYLASQEKSESDLKGMVEVHVDFLGYCWFSKGVKIASIKEHSMFKEGGAKNSVEDIKPFNTI